MDQVSEDQGLPIGHASDITLTPAFVLGSARDNGRSGHQVDHRQTARYIRRLRP